ncbi:unnamed protein product [Heligmosomoides polygyrus]|uniref:Endo/exonuclease/phosphatase domain-containing protein n=1 Tax=Heligmosomoides polygyrus TaxID=6339 RepID=A0A183GD28_HELPZ|nr:unnamed protein product [Heligmosomoides polygyrus]
MHSVRGCVPPAWIVSVSVRQKACTRWTGSTCKAIRGRLESLIRLRKLKTTKMTICTYNYRTLALEASVEDLMMQARKIKYDVIGLAETRRYHPYTPLTLEKNCPSEHATAGE